MATWPRPGGRGAAAVKVFLAYPELGIMCSTRRLIELMSRPARLGLLVQVHCENGPLIEALTAGALGAGQPRRPGSSPTPGRPRWRRRRWRAPWPRRR